MYFQGDALVRNLIRNCEIGKTTSIPVCTSDSRSNTHIVRYQVCFQRTAEDDFMLESDDDLDLVIQSSSVVQYSLVEGLVMLSFHSF